MGSVKNVGRQDAYVKKIIVIPPLTGSYLITCRGALYFLLPALAVTVYMPGVRCGFKKLRAFLSIVALQEEIFWPDKFKKVICHCSPD